MRGLFVVLCAIAVVAAKPMSDEAKEEFKKIHEICSSTTGMAEEDIMNMYEEDSDDPKLKDHMLCVMKELDVMDDDGEIHEDVLTEKLTLYMDDEDKAKEIVSKCAKKMDTPDDTAHHMGKCIHEHKTRK